MIQARSEFTSLHDAELIDVSIDRIASTVKMNFRRENGTLCKAELYGVKAFRSIDLTTQNVVRRLLRSSRNEISADSLDFWLAWVTSLSDSSSWLSDLRKQEWLSGIEGGRIELILFEPSAGAEIAVVCETFAFG